MPDLRVLSLALLGALALTSTGCSDARCDPGEVGDAWKPHASLLPDAAVVCGPNRRSAAKPSDVVDDYPPTHVFVFYEEKSPPAAMEATIAKLERAGWKLSKMDIIGEGKHAIYKAAATQEDGTSIQISINRNDWGTQGSFDLELPKP